MSLSGPRCHSTAPRRDQDVQRVARPNVGERRGAHASPGFETRPSSEALLAALEGALRPPVR